jgi:hypothetical protein
MTNDEVLANYREEMTRVLAERDVLQAAVERVEAEVRWLSEAHWRDGVTPNLATRVAIRRIGNALSADLSNPGCSGTGSAPTTPPRANGGAQGVDGGTR